MDRTWDYTACACNQNVRRFNDALFVSSAQRSVAYGGQHGHVRPENRELQRCGGYEKVHQMRRNEFIAVVTSLSLSAGEALETYRWRRPLEMYFKRPESIPDFGDLPKKNPAA
jgi:hypothetical protein